MFLLSTFEHAFATAATDVVKIAKFVESKVLPELRKANASAATLESVTALVSPQAANIERVGFGILGLAIKAIQDAEAAVGAGGVNLTLDASLVADIKSLIPAIQSQSALGYAAANAATPAKATA